MLEYLLVRADSASDLMMKVQATIRDGWKPQGGVTVSQGWTRDIWAQAIVRETKDDQDADRSDTARSPGD